MFLAKGLALAAHSIVKRVVSVLKLAKGVINCCVVCNYGSDVLSLDCEATLKACQ